ncbi:hypothetical protein EMIHUDRAFT_420286, partial [Emiliania huxleyi CCMP1516]|uniref:Uncharacterized protein n=2 Tax=Emiliania huxleyi TaxID=2903 RepID=A0A0D3L295_EMIH1
MRRSRLRRSSLPPSLRRSGPRRPTVCLLPPCRSRRRLPRRLLHLHLLHLLHRRRRRRRLLPPLLAPPSRGRPAGLRSRRSRQTASPRGPAQRCPRQLICRPGSRGCSRSRSAEWRRGSGRRRGERAGFSTRWSKRWLGGAPLGARMTRASGGSGAASLITLLSPPPGLSLGGGAGSRAAAYVLRRRGERSVMAGEDCSRVAGGSPSPCLCVDRRTPQRSRT